ncbi:phosphoglycerate dehydrogenase [Sporolactobacillus sp. THM19-2]|uniref:phosphoglycerate dehydrogenase n=1 Tax=Sporolactobacillus sp. THM19-2 TaxID=2511171 RepID=UPI00101EC668|nr:phosphoglycerate dehydrogenase [Sporolactobacillus sp. THM19-2]RYL89257.1 glycerate dehydrogenase [Sporolactobacillus sp. THM19-2]
MKILFCVGKSYYSIHQNMVRQLEAAGADVCCLMYDEAQDKQKIIHAIHDAEIYITAVSPADREVIDAAPQLKYILKTGTGLDNVAIEYATEKGICVSNAPGENAISVAELAIGLMISISRMIPQLDRRTKDGHWNHSNGFECYGKTLGIIGFGAIGQRIARMASAFSMKLMTYGVHKDFDQAAEIGATFVDLDHLLAESDYIVISTSLKKTNFHMIDAGALEKMKQTAFLINVSRGALIDEPALLDALKKKKIAGAALDVFESEPPVPPLPHLENLIATPHIGGTTQESIWRVAQVTIENVRRFIRHESPTHVVNRVDTFK